MDSQNESRREREIITEFISLYIDLPCLWDIGSDLYKDKNQKTQAWELLKDKLKEIDPEANIAAAKRKVEHMQSAFKREYKKVKESKRTGAGANDVHIPNLWYYNLLLPIFEKKDDQSRCGVDTLSSDDESRSSEHEQGRKKMRNTLEMKKQTLIETAQELLLKSDDRNENQKKINSFGLYVGEQLDQVETFQRQVAEKLISDILFLAKTGNLNFESRIETTAIPRNFAFSRSSSSNNSYHYQTSSSPYSLPPPSPSLQEFQLVPSPHHIQPPPSPQHFQFAPSPHYIQPSPSSQHSQPAPSPHHMQPSPPSQYNQPAPSPNHIQPSTASKHSQQAPSPRFQIISQGFQAAPSQRQIQRQLPANDENENSSPSSQHSQPAPSPHHMQPSPPSQYNQPAPSPNHIQPSTASKHSQQAPSPRFQIISQGFQAAPSQRQIQRQLPANDENENNSPSSQHSQPASSPHHMQPSPPSQYNQPAPSPNHIQPSTASKHSQQAPSPHFQIISQGFQGAPSQRQIQRQLPANDENENSIVQISIPSPSHVMSNDTNSIIYEGPASGINDLIIFKKDK